MAILTDKRRCPTPLLPSHVDNYRFAINLVVPILNILLFNKRSGSVKQITLQGGLVKAAANLGCIIGQIGFGTLGDIFGRRRVWPAVSGGSLPQP